MAHVVYVLGALVEVGVPKHLRYDDHGDVKGLVTHHKVPVMFANALALHVLEPPDAPLVPGRSHFHLVKHQFLISHMLRSVTWITLENVSIGLYSSTRFVHSFTYSLTLQKRHGL